MQVLLYKIFPCCDVLACKNPSHGRANKHASSHGEKKRVVPTIAEARQKG